MRYDGPLAVTFRNSPVAPNGVGLFPVQLLEAALNLGLFACFCAVFRSRDRAGRVSCTGLYLCAYAVIRFFVEFLRGDTARGLWLGLSTSQWCSVAALAAGLWLLLRRRKTDAGPSMQ